MIYRKRADVNGVCHTHSVFATAWASTELNYRVVVAELAALVGVKDRYSSISTNGYYGISRNSGGYTKGTGCCIDG